jgi:hypothetical protein
LSILFHERKDILIAKLIHVVPAVRKTWEMIWVLTDAAVGCDTTPRSNLFRSSLEPSLIRYSIKLESCELGVEDVGDVASRPHLS